VSLPIRFVTICVCGIPIATLELRKTRDDVLEEHALVVRFRGGDAVLATDFGRRADGDAVVVVVFLAGAGAGAGAG